MVRDDPAAVGRAVEELLRFLGIVHSGIPRTTTQDVEVGGVTIPADSLVVLALAAANRDPGLLAGADRLDVTRDAGGHLAFGHGVPPLPGRPARADGDADRLPGAAAAVPAARSAVPFEEVGFRAFHFIYGLQALPVTW